MASNPVEILERMFRIYGFLGDVNKVLQQEAEAHEQRTDAEPTRDAPEDDDTDLWQTIPDLDPYALLGLHRGAPCEVVDAAFKALAKKYHPDRGGDPQMMARLAAAYEQIKEERK